MKNRFNERIKLLKKIKKDKHCSMFINNIVKYILSNRTTLCAGNGGSCAESDHFVSELMGRYNKDRRSYSAFSLNNSAVLTCVGNDYNFEEIFSRQLEPYKWYSSVMIVLFTTSGNSSNILKALETCRNLPTFLFTGKKGGRAVKQFKNLIGKDNIYVVPSMDTALIQEVHLMMIHDICEILDNKNHEF